MLPVTEILEACTAAPGGQPFSFSSPERDGRSHAPVVVWNLTNTCNMSCPHCYSAAVKERSEYGLSTRELKGIALRLQEAGVRVLILSGGEPLMRYDVEEIAAFCREAGMVCHLSTNGVLLSTDRARSLRQAGIVYAGVSLDGLADFNDRYRGLKNALERAMAGLEEAGRAGMRTGMRMTLTSANAAHLVPLLQLADLRLVDRFYVSHLVYGGRALSMMDGDLCIDESRTRMENLFSEALNLLRGRSKTKIVTGGNDVDGAALHRFVCRELGEQAGQVTWQALLKRGGNSAGEKIINVDHRGDVHPDQFWRGTDCGNLLHESLHDILARPLFNDLRQREKFLKGRCMQCRYLSICRGSHRERALAVSDSGDIWGDDPSCYLSDSEISVENYKTILSEEGRSVSRLDASAIAFC